MAHVIDYDGVADRYGRRYELYGYAGVRDAVLKFVGGGRPAVAEIGCGSGHWLETLSGRVGRLAGVDPSVRMLAHARAAAPAALIVRGRGTALPFRDAVFDRIVCVNALHHFGDRLQFFGEARRLLRSGGGVLTVGLDPHAERDRWWVYDHFERTREFDAARFAPVRTLRGEIARAGFSWAESYEADRIDKTVSLADALASGVIDRSFTSELMILSDEEYERGVTRLRQADAERTAGGGTFELVTDLRLYATVGWV